MQPAECVLMSEVDDAELVRLRPSLPAELMLSSDIVDSRDMMLVHEPVELQLERRARVLGARRAALIMLVTVSMLLPFSHISDSNLHK